MFGKYPVWVENDNWASNDFVHKPWVISEEMGINRRKEAKEVLMAKKNEEEAEAAV